MFIIVIIGVITANMGREHKHAPICGKSTPLCRFMELYAEGHIKDQQDGHYLISQLFERLYGFSEAEIKKYNLNSRKRQMNLGLCYGINCDVPPTDFEEYLVKLKKLHEKREEMKKKKNSGANCQNAKRKIDDTGCDTEKKKQCMSECFVGESMSGERQASSTDRMASSTDRMASSTDGPVQSTERPASSSERLARLTRLTRLAKLAKRPGLPTERPGLPTERPASSTERPASPTKRPASSTERPASPTERPASPTERPASPTERPASTTERPASPTDSPTYLSDEDVSMGKEYACSSDKETSASDNQPLSSDKQASSSEEWQWVDGQWIKCQEWTKQMNDEVNDEGDGGIKCESISLDELEEELASINHVYGSKEDWDRKIREWQDMLYDAEKFLPKKDKKKRTNDARGKEKTKKSSNDENDFIVID